MTESQKPNSSDYRRALALILHHRRGDNQGVAVVAEETNAEDRLPQLVHAVLKLHQVLIAMLRTESGIDLLGDWVGGMAALSADEPPGTDVVRAAQILNFHGQGNGAAVAEVMNAATLEGRHTQVFLQLLDLYEVALPEISGPGGMEWLAAQIHAFIEDENRLDDA